MGKLEERTGDRLKILAVNVGARQTLEIVRKYREIHDIKYTVLFDATFDVCRAYRIRGIPTFIRVDAEGVITYRGYKPPEEYLEMME